MEEDEEEVEEDESDDEDSHLSKLAPKVVDKESVMMAVSAMPSVSSPARTSWAKSSALTLRCLRGYQFVPVP